VSCAAGDVVTCGLWQLSDYRSRRVVTPAASADREELIHADLSEELVSPSGNASTRSLIAGRICTKQKAATL